MVAGLARIRFFAILKCCHFGECLAQFEVCGGTKATQSLNHFFCSWVGSVATVIPGMMSKTEVLDNLAILKTEIPPDFWAELKAEGLLRADTRT